MFGVLRNKFQRCRKHIRHSQSTYVINICRHDIVISAKNIISPFRTTKQRILGYLYLCIITSYFVLLDDVQHIIYGILDTPVAISIANYFSHWPIKLLVASSVVALACLCYKRSKFKVSISWNKIYTLLLISIFLASNQQIVYVNVFCLTYQFFIGCFIAIELIYELSACVSFIPHTNPSGFQCRFTSNAPTEKLIYSHRHSYAETVAKMISNTDISSESYAIGISGAWGSGKSTFLNDLASILDSNDFTIVNFRPWDNQGAHQIIKSFFECLDAVIDRCNVHIHHYIWAYAKLLLAAYDDSGVLDKLFTNTDLIIDKDLENRKQLLAQSLVKSNTKIVISIDDIDRLEAKEIIEVLRLIRNTADFRNVVYLVPYDKQYVASQLSTLGIHDGPTFLEKIFPIEIFMPHVESLDLVSFMKDALRDMTIAPKANSILDKRSDSEIKLLRQALTNFRLAKIFANSYAIDLNFFIQHNDVSIDYGDLMFINLLKIVDTKIYDQLRCEPETLLYPEHNQEKHAVFYVLKNGIDSNQKLDEISSNKNYTGEAIKSALVINILQRLFNKQRQDYKNITLVTNYNSYFTLNISNRILSDNEFNTLLTSTDVIQSVKLWDWCNARERKNVVSICAQFAKANPRGLQSDKHLQYYKILAKWLAVESNESSIIADIFVSYTTVIKQRKSLEYRAVLLALLQQPQSRILIAKCLVALYNFSMTKQTYQSILSDSDIQHLIQLNINLFLNNSKHDAIELLQLKTTAFTGMFLCHVVTHGAYTTNLMYNAVYSKFSSEKSKEYRLLAKCRQRLSNLTYKKGRIHIFGGEDNLTKYMANCFIDAPQHTEQ